MLPQAVEEAVRLREKLKDTVKQITLVTIGPSKAQETLRTGLAMGADKAIHIEIPDTSPSPEPLAVAKALKAVVDKEKPELVLLGKQAIDDDAGQTGQMLAGLTGWAQATFASKVEVDAPGRTVTVTREVDGGLQEVKCKLPAIITTDLRHVSLPSLFVSPWCFTS
jgi:electron transfer flavoprotein beta subunit